MDDHADIEDALPVFSQRSTGGGDDGKTCGPRRTRFYYASGSPTTAVGEVRHSVTDVEDCDSSPCGSPPNTAQGHNEGTVAYHSAVVSTTIEDYMDVDGSISQPTAPVACCPTKDPAPPPPPSLKQGVASVPFKMAATAITSTIDASQQAAACFPPHQPLLLQAGPGSGKTQTMASRIGYLLHCGVSPRSILGICFTRQAAETLRQRVQTTLPPFTANCAAALKLKTLHSFGLECLRRFGVIEPGRDVYDARKQHQLAKRVVAAFAEREKSSEAVSRLVAYVNRVKAMKKPPIQQPNPEVQEAYLFPFYEKELHEECNAIDFGDMQRMFYDLLRPVVTDAATGRDTTETTVNVGSSPKAAIPQLASSPACDVLQMELTHIVVDEFQDLNEIQVEILAFLAGDACRVTCVGDPNQCIYTWRGAMPDIFGAWQRRFPQTTRLTLAMNYRSDPPIVTAVNNVVQATQRPFHDRSGCTLMQLNCQSCCDEMQAIPLVVEYLLRHRDRRLRYGDVAILCRTKRRVEMVFEALQSSRIPVRELRRVSPDQLSTMRSLLSFLHLCVSSSGWESDADVRTILTLSPLHRLPARATKQLFLSLGSMCEERHSRHRRNTANGPSSSSSSPNSSGSIRKPLDDPGDIPVREGPVSYFAILQEIVFHNFSNLLYPKLDISKQNQKILRRLVQLILHAQELLAMSSCDVEQVLRYVLMEGGYDSDSTVVARGASASRSSHGSSSFSAKRGRDGGSVRHTVGSQLMEDVVAHYNTEGNGRMTATPGLSSMSVLGSRRASHRKGTVEEEEDHLIPPEEEYALLHEKGLSLSALLLETYHTVWGAIKAEASKGGTEAAPPLVDAGENASEAAYQETSNAFLSPRPPGQDDSVSNSSVSCSLLQLRYPPVMVLRRVLDEFLSLTSSDDYGQLHHGHENEDESVVGAAGKGPLCLSGEVTVCTVHRAKGMEWPVILLPGCWVGEFPIRTRDAEERRIFFVAMSRAMRHLVCFTAQSSDDALTYSCEEQMPPSPAAANSTSSKTLLPSPYLDNLVSSMEHLSFEVLRKQMSTTSDDL